METVCLVPGRDFIAGYIPGAGPCAFFFRLPHQTHVLGVGCFEKATRVPGFARRAKIFNGEKLVSWSSQGAIGKSAYHTAFWAFAAAALGGAFQQEFTVAVFANARVPFVLRLGQ